MNVRVIIVTQADESCYMSVWFPAARGETWAKGYRAKLICMIELVSLGFLSSTREIECQLSDFNKQSAVMVFQTAIEREVLRAAGFVEQNQNYIN
jgi:hypothetical protein